MAILVHRYDAPDRFVAGTVGQPGERTFFLQAREGKRITSVACEKQQVSVLAEHLDRVLDEVLRRRAGVVDVPPQRAGRDRCRRGLGRQDHSLVRPRFCGSRPSPRRCGPPILSVLSAAARPARAHLPTGERLSPTAVRLNSAVTVDDLGLTDDGDARPSHAALTAELAQAELQITGRLLQASNATFLAELQTAGAPIECVYKPFEGERPL